MNEVGEHQVTLTVADEWGNEGTAVFTINVTEPETGCGAANASIAAIGLLGVVLFFVRRREWQ
jgi:LPXTG-motif cell wall-anchored protein